MQILDEQRAQAPAEIPAWKTGTFTGDERALAAAWGAEGRENHRMLMEVGGI